MKLTTAVRNARINTTVQQLDASANPAKLRVYAGTVPASSADAITDQTLLVEFALDDPSFPGAANATTSANGLPKTAAAAASGTPTFARLVTGDDTTIGQLAPTEFTLNPNQTTQGVDVTLTALTLSEPESC